MSRLAIVCALCVVTSPVMADQKGVSWGVMLGSSNYSEPGFSFDMPTITGRLSYNVNRFIDVEARLAYGDSNSDNGVSMGINWLTGAYAKARWEVLERLYVTAIGGYTFADTTAKGAGWSSSVTDDGISGGLGLDFYADSSSGINVEWMRYLDSTLRGADYTLEHIGIGYFQKF